MENSQDLEALAHNRSVTTENKSRAHSKLPGYIKELRESYHQNRPTLEDTDPEIFDEKQQNQDNAVQGLIDINVSLIEEQSSVSKPAMLIRFKGQLFDSILCEVRSLDRGAETGPALFVTADPSLQSELCVGDIVVLARDGSKIIDVDNKFPRAGETATVSALHHENDFPYVLEPENEGYISKRIDAFKWGRLARDPQIGDRVKVMGGAIHGFASGESSSPFKVVPKDDLDHSDLHGPVPNYALSMILAMVDRHFNCGSYPPAGRFGNNDAFLFYGPPGIGKTFSVSVAWSIVHRKYNNNGNGEQVVFLRIEGSAIEGSLVGSGPKTLREIRSAAQQARDEGKLPIVFINEAGSLLRSREVQSMQLDGGSSLSTHEQFLAMTSGPNAIPGILIVDLNMEKILDEATRQRFMCIPFPPISTETFVDRMFKTAIEKEKALFQGNWENYRQALEKCLDTTIGTVLVGSETVPVKVGNLCSGRMYESVMQECVRLLNLHIFSSRAEGMEPLLLSITGSMLYYVLTKRSWSLFKCWDDKQAREMLVPDICRPEKSNSISNPSPYQWHEIEMEPQFDCREVFDEIAYGLLDDLETEY